MHNIIFDLINKIMREIIKYYSNTTTSSQKRRKKKSKLNSKKDAEFVGCIKYMWKTNRKRMMKCRQRRIKKYQRFLLLFDTKMKRFSFLFYDCDGY